MAVCIPGLFSLLWYALTRFVLELRSEGLANDGPVWHPAARALAPAPASQKKGHPSNCTISFPPPQSLPHHTPPPDTLAHREASSSFFSCLSSFLHLLCPSFSLPRLSRVCIRQSVSQRCLSSSTNACFHRTAYTRTRYRSAPVYRLRFLLPATKLAFPAIASPR